MTAVEVQSCGWDGPNDAWLESDQVFATWLQAMAVFRRELVLVEALSPEPEPPTVTGPRREPKPQPKPRPRPTPAPKPTRLDDFTAQQTRIAERILGINTEKKAR